MGSSKKTMKSKKGTVNLTQAKSLKSEEPKTQEPKLPQYDWLGVPLQYVETKVTGKMFTEPVWEERYMEALHKGYKIHSFNISGGYIYFLFVK